MENGSFDRAIWADIVQNAYRGGAPGVDWQVAAAAFCYYF
jgi:hypothetical protein